MPKNKGEGGRSFRRRDGGGGRGGGSSSGGLVVKGEDQAYGMVTRVLGDSRFSATIVLGDSGAEVEAVVHAPGSMRKRDSWLCVGDTILVSLRPFESREKRKVDLVHLYTADDARALKLGGHLTAGWAMRAGHDAAGGDGEDAFEFGVADAGDGGGAGESGRTTPPAPSPAPAAAATAATASGANSSGGSGGVCVAAVDIDAI